jgi:hypothetical protein
MWVYMGGVKLEITEGRKRWEQNGCWKKEMEYYVCNKKLNENRD